MEGKLTLIEFSTCRILPYAEHQHSLSEHIIEETIAEEFKLSTDCAYQIK